MLFGCVALVRISGVFAFNAYALRADAFRPIRFCLCVCILFACVSDLYVLDAFVFNDAYALHADTFRPSLFHSCVRINLFGFISGVCVLDAFMLDAYGMRFMRLSYALSGPARAVARSSHAFRMCAFLMRLC